MKAVGRSLSILSNVRKYLTPAEIKQLIEVAKRQKTPFAHRNATMIVVAYHHGLRVSELVSLEWNQLNLADGSIFCRRLKNGIGTTHPLTSGELKALKRLKREHSGDSRWVFLSQRRTAMSRQNFHAMLQELGKVAGIEIPLHAHLFRHSTATKLVNDGRDIRSIAWYMGHKNLNSSAIYTHLTPNRFNGWFSD